MRDVLMLVGTSIAVATTEVVVFNKIKEDKLIVSKKHTLNNRLNSVVHGGIDNDYVLEDMDVVEVLYAYRKMSQDYRDRISIEEFIANRK